MKAKSKDPANLTIYSVRPYGASHFQIAPDGNWGKIETITKAEFEAKFDIITETKPPTIP